MGRMESKSKVRCASSPIASASTKTHTAGAERSGGLRIVSLLTCVFTCPHRLLRLFQVRRKTGRCYSNSMLLECAVIYHVTFRLKRKEW